MLSIQQQQQQKQQQPPVSSSSSSTVKNVQVQQPLGLEGRLKESYIHHVRKQQPPSPSGGGTGGGQQQSNNDNNNKGGDYATSEEKEKGDSNDEEEEDGTAAGTSEGDEEEDDAETDKSEKEGDDEDEDEEDNSNNNSNNKDGDDEKGGDNESDPVRKDTEGTGNKATTTTATSGSGWNPTVIEKKGTGPTKVGYVKDFLNERGTNNNGLLNVVTEDGVMRTALDPYTTLVASLVNEKSVRSCTTTVGTFDQRCLDRDTPLIVYNPQTFPRTWCGQTVPPQTAITMKEHCTDPTVHIFPTMDVPPPVTGEHMPPIVIQSKMDEPITTTLETVECNIPCQQEKGLMEGGKDVLYIGGESWTVTQTMADSALHHVAVIERRDYMKDHYYSTQSFLSSVPLTYFDFSKHNVRNRPAVPFDTVQPKAVYLVNDNCSSYASKRHKYFAAIAGQVSVDSYGSCGHNIDVPDGMTISTPEGRIRIMEQYRIVLALDESSSKDHVSDMVWEALLSGSLPVVVGADNIRDLLPPKSFINFKDFNTWDDLALYVKKVLTDKDLWESYHTWRNDETILTAMEGKYEFTRTSPTCRLCRWAYAKKYGLGWDHEKQQVQQTRLPKDKLCTTADHGLVSKPFGEQWVTKKKSNDSGVTDEESVVEKILLEDSEGESCTAMSADGDIDFDSYKCHRMIVHHDGVTDIVISDSARASTDTEVILRLTFPGIRNPDGAFFHNTHLMVPTQTGTDKTTTTTAATAKQISSATIQDATMKVTVLADWQTSVTSSGEGIVDIVIQSKDVGPMKDESIRRIRVIIEEMVVIYDKMTEYYPSSFSKVMMKDFMDPLGVYYADS